MVTSPVRRLYLALRPESNPECDTSFAYRVIGAPTMWDSGARHANRHGGGLELAVSIIAVYGPVTRRSTQCESCHRHFSCSFSRSRHRCLRLPEPTTSLAPGSMRTKTPRSKSP